MLSIEIGNVKANGKVTTEGFVVLKGATVNEKNIRQIFDCGCSEVARKSIFRMGM